MPRTGDHPNIKAHHFDRSNARAYGLRASQVKTSLRQRIKELELANADLLARLEAKPVSHDDYLGERILSTRAHIARLDKLMMTERDPQKLQWLATTLAKLSEVERILSGRPNPGHLRPSSTPSRRGRSSALVPE